MRWSPTPSEVGANSGEEGTADSVSNDVDAEWMKYCAICNKDIFASTKFEVDERFEEHLRRAHPEFLSYADDDDGDDDDGEYDGGYDDGHDDTTGFGDARPREKRRGKDGT